MGCLRALFLVATSFVLGCISSESVVCASGIVCPAGYLCSEDGRRCYAAEQLAACEALPELAACTVRGSDGVCIGGVCTPARCGDGIATGAEECDGGDLGDLADCRDLGYYASAPLTCGASCRYDRSACTSGLCGDGARNGPEVCDGQDLALHDCRDLGFYEPGPLTCNDACSYNTSACVGYCGDAILNGPEVCEEGLPILDTCISYGYDRGYLACSRCLPDISACHFIGWRTLPTPVSALIRAIHGTSRRNVFAAGTGGALIRWDGTRWTAMPAATPDHFTAVVAFADDHAHALGELGTIQRYDGTGWTTVFSDPSWRFNAVTRAGTSEAFAVGNRGVLRFNGTSWSAFSAPSANELIDIWGASASELYTVDSNGSLARYNGSAWQNVMLPGNASAQAVFGGGPGDVYAITSSGVMHLVGTTWQTIQISFGPLTTGTVNGSGGVCVVGPQGNVWCHDGQYWNMLVGTVSGFGELGAVWASAHDDVFVAGTGGIQHFAGSQWFAMVYPATPLNYWGDSNVLYAAAGTVSRMANATQFTTVLTPQQGNALYGIWGSGPSDVFAVGEGGAIYRFNGSSWSKMNQPDQRTLMSAWGTGPTNVYAVGNTGAILRYPGSWNPVASATTSDLKAVWGSGPDDIFAVGSGGTIVHHDGTSFAPMASGTTRILRAVFGTSPTNVYAAGDVGTLLHYDGTGWTSIPTGTAVTLKGIWGSSASDIFVVGDLGMMLHFDGTRWTRIKRPSGNINAIYGFRNEIHLGSVHTQVLIRFGPW